METFQLPPVLVGNLDLAAVNQKLRSGTAKLDWSLVNSVSGENLEVLLAGLTAQDEDVLGVDTISDRLADDILPYLEEDTANSQADSPIEQTSNDSIGEKEPPIENGNFLQNHGPTDAQLRNELVAKITNDLLGPVQGEEEEVNEAHVCDRYLLGLLAPKTRNKRSTTSEVENQHNLADSESANPEEGETENSVPSIETESQDNLANSESDNPEEGEAENSVPATPSLFPSSMGMSFCVSSEASEIEITTTWGTYKKRRSEIHLNKKGNPQQVWKRTPRQATFIQSLQDSKHIEQFLAEEDYGEVAITGKIHYQNHGNWIVTLFLENRQEEPPGRNRDAAWLFQPQIQVRSPQGDNDAIFLRKPLPDYSQNLDPAIRQENQAMAMRDRWRVEFAVGHGVSVSATTLENNPQKATCVSTSVIPSYEVGRTTQPTEAEIPELANVTLDMKALAEMPASQLTAKLQPLVDAYSRWIEEQNQRIDDPNAKLENYREIAADSIQQCRTACHRLQEGIQLLQTNSDALTAFHFMNRAMWQQRIHSVYASQKRRGDSPDFETIDQPKSRCWYPFQLAFILLNLPSLTDLHHPDRSPDPSANADLLWFPTGGGKTEAYLGLTAYTLGIRRLQGTVSGRNGESGVAVLMRYTLRLLTLQQFQRAATLICACEKIRRENPQQWGSEPFRLGLWVGRNSTPNSTQQSEEAVKQDRGNGPFHQTGSPYQLTFCPWCGNQIQKDKHIEVASFKKSIGRTLIYCGDRKCSFSKKKSTNEGIPVVVVDEEIYRRLPALLIATVDKFAQMPWKGEIQTLFGQVNGYCDRHGFRSPDLHDENSHRQTNQHPAAKTHACLPLRPPDLIIQDELHLIGGPLGSLVGLYETAVDQLSTWEANGRQVRPKVVASTATIRQAKAQVRNLFLRNLQIFPPQGLDSEDNFFARQRRPSQENFGRLYLGICASGRRLKAAMIRVYVAALAAAQTLYEKYGDRADPWMTLVGYFNSLRELGGTRRLVDDDIRSRLRHTDERGLAKRTLSFPQELTSRRASTDIPKLLDRLEVPFHPQKQEENRKSRKQQQTPNYPDPLDVVLATNMISVGVDVQRLSMMVVCSQPKNTAEYIQATSRVGRKFPGLVLTVYNWSRPRDLSHYERFQHYHATFYQNVEALSVTPFAPGACDRGLSALLVSLLRLWGMDLNGNDRAGYFSHQHPYVQTAVDAIVRRATAIDGEATGDRLRQELEQKIDNWCDRIRNLEKGTTLKYQVRSRDGTSISLLQNPTGEWHDFTCLNSLRNVESQVPLLLTEEPPDDERDREPQPMSDAN